MHSSKQAVCFLAHLTHADMRTHVGRNILGISRDCCTSFEDLTSQKVKSSMKYAPVPEDEEWKVYLIRDLVAASLENKVDVPLSPQEIEDILNYGDIWRGTFLSLGSPVCCLPLYNYQYRLCSSNIHEINL